MDDSNKLSRPQLFIYDINKKSKYSQSAQCGNHSLLQEYIETLQQYLQDETIYVMHSSYSFGSAHITIRTTREDESGM
ncbi:hypothetical protein ASPWEDRAFT_44907 [Aspergillus wentii DTO 134E9]|uniref:Uncharacterized protein n=1 Tax=Aspergillus wentii DTO 134E9 TaxID=1073089 RepID=A0A1L9R7S3_ASPWE|nr:uncharacterized protein ASPWEDRAFT_44907 [Aspergillus wentii DTO 134E9]OJJ30954.1 hypothetical protein ASPWEDRAFT_44907 [Aspergillus wentii DTO 134E9]